MIGGHFYYLQHQISQAAEDVKLFIEKVEKGEVNEWGYNPSEIFGKKEILDKFKLTIDYLEKSAKMLNEVDYFISGDTGEESFFARWKEKELP